MRNKPDTRTFFDSNSRMTPPLMPEQQAENDGRYGHIDALKGAGILLVVFGHYIEQASSRSEILHSAYIDIYSFHMPLFVFLSGIFARESLRSRDYQKIIWTLFFPLVVFQFIYIVVGRLTDWYSYSVFAPYWLLWFIASMIGWRILLPLFASPIGLIVSLAGAVLAGYDNSVGYALSASRTIYFMPFFIFGHLYGMQLVEIARKHRGAFIILFVACLVAVTLWWENGLHGAALTGSHNYDSAPPNDEFPGLARLLVILLSTATLLGFCALVPTGPRALRSLGERSLSVYLIHGLVVMITVSAGLLAIIPGFLLIPACLAIAVTVAALTSLLDGPMRRIFRPPPHRPALHDPIPRWLSRFH